VGKRKKLLHSLQEEKEKEIERMGEQLLTTEKSVQTEESLRTLVRKDKRPRKGDDLKRRRANRESGWAWKTRGLGGKKGSSYANRGSTGERGVRPEF